MLSCDDLISYDSYPDLSDVSLDLYRDFSRNVLLKRRFHYFFDDDTEAIVEFQEYGIRHMLGIQHIDGNVSKNDFFGAIDNGLSFDVLCSTNSKTKRFKKMKSRIRLFACTYNTMRYGRVFYYPNREIPNTKNVNMDYIIFREIEPKGFNIGIRYENGCYVPLSILVANDIKRDKYIDKNNIKIVKKLKIIDLQSVSLVEELNYSDTFITSSL